MTNLFQPLTNFSNSLQTPLPTFTIDRGKGRLNVLQLNRAQGYSDALSDVIPLPSWSIPIYAIADLDDFKISQVEGIHLLEDGSRLLPEHGWQWGNTLYVASRNPMAIAHGTLTMQTPPPDELNRYTFPILNALAVTAVASGGESWAWERGFDSMTLQGSEAIAPGTTTEIQGHILLNLSNPMAIAVAFYLPQFELVDYLDYQGRSYKVADSSRIPKVGELLWGDRLVKILMPIERAAFVPIIPDRYDGQGYISFVGDL